MRVDGEIYHKHMESGGVCETFGLPCWLNVKESTFSAGDAGDLGLIPGSESFLGGTHSSILAWRIPWTEEPGGLQSMGSQSQTRRSMSRI